LGGHLIQYTGERIYHRGTEKIEEVGKGESEWLWGAVVDAVLRVSIAWRAGV
jgi:hypothetical protein